MATTTVFNPARIPRPIFWIGLGCLLLSASAAAVLAASHLNLLEAPGCGEGSGCDRAVASPWSKVPGLKWPVSFVGLAYFAALAFAWFSAPRAGGVPAAFRWLIRAGAVASAAFIVVMIAGGYLCLYCLVLHLGNFGFLVASEIAPTVRRGAGRWLGWAAAGFAAVTSLEFGALSRAQAGLAETLARSTERIIAASGQESAAAFTGRYLIGPEQAPIRLVIISDYQCPDCRSMEAQIRRVLKQRDDVSFSAKHFPFCPDCNRHIRNNKHPNACWAARAAETAGILRGPEGFWQMHKWLFDRGGSFTNSELHAGLAELGYDPGRFAALMQGDEPLRLVQADIEEARALGIHFTPMVFINGVELKGWNIPGALSRAVDQVAATSPPTAAAVTDRPPPAARKYIQDWRDQRARPLGPDARSWATGPVQAPVNVVLWGDYQEPFTATADQSIREILAVGGDVRYTFRHYPFNQECNPSATTTRHPQACLAARAAEAAGSLGGPAGYWRMHEWLMSNQRNLDADSIRRAAATLGLDPDALAAAMEQPEVAAAIAEDAQAGKRLGLRSIPMIFVNGKFVPRWQLDGRSMLGEIVEEARR